MQGVSRWQLDAPDQGWAELPLSDGGQLQRDNRPGALVHQHEGARPLSLLRHRWCGQQA